MKIKTLINNIQISQTIAIVRNNEELYFGPLLVMGSGKLIKEYGDLDVLSISAGKNERSKLESTVLIIHVKE